MAAVFVLVRKHVFADEAVWSELEQIGNISEPRKSVGDLIREGMILVRDRERNKQSKVLKSVNKRRSHELKNN